MCVCGGGVRVCASADYFQQCNNANRADYLYLLARVV